MKDLASEYDGDVRVSGTVQTWQGSRKIQEFTDISAYKAFGTLSIKTGEHANYTIERVGDDLVMAFYHKDGVNTFTIHRTDGSTFFKSEKVAVATYLVNGTEFTAKEFFKLMKKSMSQDSKTREDLIDELESEHGAYIEIGQMSIPLIDIIDEFGNGDFEDMICEHGDKIVDEIEFEIDEKIENAVEDGTVFSRDADGDEFTVVVTFR